MVRLLAQNQIQIQIQYQDYVCDYWVFIIITLVGHQLLLTNLVADLQTSRK